ncbi:MAG: FAD:protein FMN transferase [Clostridia bacterium]|nr:FAD:protein FMN transferase [Clostridia bacterium]
MKNKKRILKIVSLLLTCAVVLSAALIIRDRKKDFNSAEKSTVAMNTIMTQKIYSEVPGSQITDIITIVNVLEKMISFKDIDSQLSILNREGTLDNGAIADVLRVCTEISEKSGGVFDVTVGELSELWGIGTENENIPEAEEISSLLSECGYEKISINGSTVTFDGDFSVDLGAVGKGMACDYIMNYLMSSEGVNGGVVSVGGSIVVYGQRNKAGDKWRVAVRHPRNEGELLGVISLSEGFVSTSGDYERYFEENGKRYHHILDAESGYPCESGLISVTVVCDSGILSDALSTACFILGREKGEKLLSEYGAAGIFVDKDMNITTVGDIDFEY